MYEVKNYPDKGAYVKLISPTKERVYKINSYQDLFMLKSLKKADPSFERVVIPCMFQQQHDEKKEGGAHELKILCDFINSCNFDEVKVFHPHSQVCISLLDEGVAISNTEYIKLVLKDLDTSNMILMSSDAGGFKPLMKLSDEIGWEDETFSASKSRSWDGEKSSLIQLIERADFGGKDVLIVDDICVYGGTFIGMAELLKDKNVGKLYLAVSHTTVQEMNANLFTAFDTVFTTNSKYDEYFVKTQVGKFVPENLKILKLWSTT